MICVVPCFHRKFLGYSKWHSTYIEHRDQAICQVGAYERLGKWKKKPFHNFSTFDMDYLGKSVDTTGKSTLKIVKLPNLKVIRLK